MATPFPPNDAKPLDCPPAVPEELAAPRPVATSDDPTCCAIGVDVGGTKSAAGVVLMPEGRVVARRLLPTGADRGGEAVLTQTIDMVQSLRDEARGQGLIPLALGVGVAELVSPAGRVLSRAIIDWQDVPLADRLGAAASLPTFIDADVRAAARAEALLGGGRGLDRFLYVTVGTGISACLILDRQPFLGAYGLTGTFASSRGLIPNDEGTLTSGPPLEEYASGPALARRYAAHRPDFQGSAAEVLDLSRHGDELARNIVETAACALGAAIGQMVNVLDPCAVIIGGGLGLAGGLYRQACEASLRRQVWSDWRREIPLVSAELKNDGPWIGAAIGALWQRTNP